LEASPSGCAREHDVLDDTEAGQEVVGLEDKSELFAAERGERLVVEVFDRTAFDGDASLRGPVEETDEIQ
jgi:hypothetical protein